MSVCVCAGIVTELFWHLSFIQTTSTVIDTCCCCDTGVYAVLGRRRARVVREEMREGSDLFSIHAYLPAQASFGFANDMRRQSSGLCCGLFHLHALLWKGAIGLAA